MRRPHCTNRVFNIIQCGYEDNGLVATLIVERVLHFDAIHLRHTYIQNNAAQLVRLNGF